MKKAFTCTGIHPLNPNIFSDNHFAPSKASSSKAHLPPCFPANIPSSPPSVNMDLSDNSDSDYVDDESMATSADEALAEERSEANFMIICETDGSSMEVLNQSNTGPAPEPSKQDVTTLPTPSTITVPQIESGRLKQHTRSSSESTYLPTMIPVISHDQFMGKNEEERWETVLQLQGWCHTLMENFTLCSAELGAANSHCTVLKREKLLQQVQENKKKKKNIEMMRLPACFVMHPDLHASFEASRTAWQEKEQAEVEKQAQKQAEEVAWIAKITENASTKIFDKPLTSYKLKDDLLTIVQALGCPVNKKDTIAVTHQTGLVQ